MGGGGGGVSEATIYSSVGQVNAYSREQGCMPSNTSKHNSVMLASKRAAMYPCIYVYERF